MQLVTFISLAIVCSTVASVLTHNEWHSFKLSYNKQYDIREEAVRFQIFTENLKRIQEHNVKYNAGKVSYKLGVNQFADMTEKEFEQYLTLRVPESFLNDDNVDIFDSIADDLPESIDYREKNAVNPVKNQGSCGSCWAFSTVGALESKFYLKDGILPVLSEQNLVDCSGSYGNFGCRGGFMEGSYNYIKDNGIESEQDYPYTAKDGECKFLQAKSLGTVKGHTNIKKGNEEALQTAVATEGPVAVGVDATKFHLYTSGIFQVTGTYRLNHAVVVVGYGSENGTDYWIIRNSWGAKWGEDGYIRLARNAGNQIGVSDLACFPNL